MRENIAFSSRIMIIRRRMTFVLTADITLKTLAADNNTMCIIMVCLPSIAQANLLVVLKHF